MKVTPLFQCKQIEQRKQKQKTTKPCFEEFLFRAMANVKEKGSDTNGKM